MQIELLFMVALILRASGGAFRTGIRMAPFRFPGWVLCAISAWIAADSVGAWVPIWPALMLGVAGFTIESFYNRQIVRTATDLSVVLASGIFSMPRLDSGVLTGILFAVVGFGWVVDILLLQLGKSYRIAIGLFPAIAMLGAATINPWMISNLFSLSKALIGTGCLLHVGLVPARAADGEQIVLETGAVAWLTPFNERGVSPGALLFHGANPDGSHQPAAVVLRHALLDAGFSVMAVDHPGYGKSPSPGIDAEIPEWNPMPTARAGLEKLRALANIDGIYAIGHSMGATDVLRLLAFAPEIRGGVLFGATVGTDPEREAYWNRRFQVDRGLHDWMPRGKVSEIRHRFYNNGVMVGYLPRDHAPIYFVRFGQEFRNIAKTRDAMYRMIPGEKALWDIPDSTHYFNSYEYKGFIIGDTRITRVLSMRLRSLTTVKSDTFRARRTERLSAAGSRLQRIDKQP